MYYYFSAAFDIHRSDSYWNGTYWNKRHLMKHFFQQNIIDLIDTYWNTQTLGPKPTWENTYFLGFYEFSMVQNGHKNQKDHLRSFFGTLDNNKRLMYITIGTIKNVIMVYPWNTFPVHLQLLTRTNAYSWTTLFDAWRL